MNNLTTGQKVGLVGAILLIVAQFLPVVIIGDVSFNFMDHPTASVFGYVGIIIGIALGALFFLSNNNAIKVVALILSIIALLYGLFMLLVAASDARIGWGLYVIFIATLIAFVGGIMNMKKRQIA